MSYCLIASLHAEKDLQLGGNCVCIHCMRGCNCDPAEDFADEQDDRGPDSTEFSEDSEGLERWARMNYESEGRNDL